jgi:hypothetical protein
MSFLKPLSILAAFRGVTEAACPQAMYSAPQSCFNQHSLWVAMDIYI